MFAREIGDEGTTNIARVMHLCIFHCINVCNNIKDSAFFVQSAPPIELLVYLLIICRYMYVTDILKM